MKRVLQAHAALLLVNFIYGANYTIAKEVMPHFIQPFGFIVIRVCVAIVLYWILHQIFIKEKVARKDLPLLALQARAAGLTFQAPRDRRPCPRCTAG